MKIFIPDLIFFQHYNILDRLRLQVGLRLLLLDRLHALCHRGRRLADRIRHVKVLENLEADVDLPARGRLGPRLVYRSGLCEEVGPLNEAVASQVRADLGQATSYLLKGVVGKGFAQNLERNANGYLTQYC
jgi:hypothetical protein